MPTAVERQALKSVRREANRLAWANNPNNVSVQIAADRRARDALEFPELSPVSSADALERLKALMLDPAVPLSRRLRAGAMVIRFELAPGGAAGLEQDQITSDAYRFFAAVSVAEVSDEHRQIALEQMALVENSRVTRADPDAIAEQREQTVALINAHRRMALAAAGCWPPPPGTRWAITAADDVELPLQSSLRPAVSLGDQLNAALAMDPAKRQELADARHQTLLMVEATNRDDRSWRALLEPDSKG